MEKNSDQAAFLLITTRSSVAGLADGIRLAEEVVWASPAYGPYCLVAYAQAPTGGELASFIESVRVRPDVDSLDARMCKHIPGDEDLAPLEVAGAEVALLLINVDYKVAKERNVAYHLRANGRVPLARAMWGPADIIAIVEAPDHESMRNLICDEIKVAKGVASNTTLYCYPQSWPD